LAGNFSPTMTTMAVHTNDHLYSSLGSSKSTPECNMCPYPIIPDIDLFLTVGTASERARISRHHDQLQEPDERSDVRRNTLRTCGCRHRGRTGEMYGAAKRIDTIRTYAAKRGLPIPWGVSISSSLHASTDADLITQIRHDRCHFFPKMGLRVYRSPRSWRNGILFVCRSAGAAPYERTCAQEDGTVRHRTRHSGYVEDLTGRGSYTFTAARTIVQVYGGGSHRRMQLPKEYRSRSFLCGNTCTKGLLKRIRTIELLKHLLDDEGSERGSMNEYSFSEQMSVVHTTYPARISILTDRQGVPEFRASSADREETMLQLRLQNKPPKIEISREPSPTNDDVAAVTIPAGNMDMATLKRSRGLSAFTYESQTVSEQPIHEQERSECHRAELRADRNVGQSNTLEIAIVGDNFYTVQHSKIGAQSMDRTRQEHHRRSCTDVTSNTGLYQRCVHVCMGAQSHFTKPTQWQ
jgi:hypothetical protein